MKRKTLLAAVLCLAVAALGVGAAPAVAADGCDCHTAVPPTATAAHAPLVASAPDCTVCHLGRAAPHTGRFTTPFVALRGSATTAGYRLSGKVYDMWFGGGASHPDVLVFLQQRAPGKDTFTDVGQATTNSIGNFGFTVTKPVRYACYRAIAAGWTGPTWTSVPTIRGLKPVPRVTLRVRGMTAGVLRLGHRLGMTATARPSDMAGETVKFNVQQRVRAEWVTRFTVKRTVSAAAACCCTYTPRARGLYRAKAVSVKSADYARVSSGWREFRVR
jgi:hypothetical protein